MEIVGLETSVLIFSFFLSVASAVVAAFALIYSIRGDRSKTGIDIRCQYAISSSIWSKEDWVSELTLENEKDRSEIVYKAYLEIGHGLYIEIEDFSDDPLILEAYGVIQRKYDPIEFYSGGTNRVTGVSCHRGVRHRIVLITSQGRHYPKFNTREREDLILESLMKNHSTRVVRPVRGFYKGRCYGSEAKYAITFTNRNGEEEVVPVYTGDHEAMKFRRFQLTRESIESKQALEDFLKALISEGKLSCQEIEVFDLESSRREEFKDYSHTVSVKPMGWVSHSVLGRCFTLRDKIASSSWIKKHTPDGR